MIMTTRRSTRSSSRKATLNSEDAVIETEIPIPVTRSTKRRSKEGGSDTQRPSKTVRYHLRSGSQESKVSNTSSTITPARIDFDKAAVSPANQVVNIYSQTNVPCQCTQLLQNPANLLATSFHNQYGEEYIQILKEREVEQIEHHMSLKEETTTAATFANLPHPDNQSSNVFGRSRAGTPVPGAAVAGALQGFQSQIIVMSEKETLPRQPDIITKNRKIVIQWLSEVAQEYNMSHFSYHLSISLVDAMLSEGPTQQQLDELSDAEEDFFLLKRTNFQALACACAWIASKIEDKDPPTQDKLSFISDHSVSVAKLRKMERTVCKQLKYRLNLVTPMHFVYGFLHASKACPNPTCTHVNPVLRNMTLYLLELSRASYPLTFVQPSHLAAAAVYLARATLGICESGSSNYWSATLEHHTGYSVEDLRETVLALHMLHLYSESDGPSSSFIKFSEAKYSRVALKTVRPVQELGLS